MMYDITPSGLIKIKRAEMRKASNDDLLSLFSRYTASLMWGGGMTASTIKSLKAELRQRGLV